MPHIDGLPLSRLIKDDPVIAGTRLTVLTSFGQTFDPAELKAAGIEAYLVNPVKQSRLFDCLASALGKAVPEPIALGTTAADSVPGPLLENVIILLAEDNHINQQVALGQLRKLGYQADAVANGTEVSEALTLLSYALILMDCQTPEMDGYETTRTLRRWEQRAEYPPPGHPPIYIIAMTANAMQGDREKGTVPARATSMTPCRSQSGISHRFSACVRKHR